MDNEFPIAIYYLSQTTPPTKVSQGRTICSGLKVVNWNFFSKKLLLTFCKLAFEGAL
jgi:hypothetical protein